MTISSQESRTLYNGDSSTVAFPTGFKFIEHIHVQVILVDANGVEDEWTENTEYTLTGAGVDLGGTVTVSTSPTDYTPQTGETLVIRRVVPNTQETDLPAGGPFPSAAVEEALDLAAMRDQQFADDAERSLRFPVTDDTALDATLPNAADRASMLLGFDAGGEPIAVDPDSVADTGSVVTPFMATVLDDNDAPTARTTLGAAGLADANTFTKTQKWAKGADVASPADGSLTLGADGNYFDITGTNAITSIDTIGVGAVVKLHFDAALTLTHHATDLILPGGASITTAAGDEAEFVEYASGDWRCTNYMKASGLAVTAAPARVVEQVVSTETGAVATGTTLIPNDDTIPQNTEGDQYMTLAITPRSATNKLRIDVTIMLAHSAAGSLIAAAIFQDSTANALAAVAVQKPTASGPATITFSHTMLAGTTSATTFKIRAGAHQAGTTTFNGSGGGRLFGGVAASSINITEYVP